ncbi:MAG TPA: hypothetical protein V6D11_08895 [Waterburya sp.]
MIGQLQRLALIGGDLLLAAALGLRRRSFLATATLSLSRNSSTQKAAGAL